MTSERPDFLSPNVELKETLFGEERYIAPDWEDMGQICFELAKKINSSDERFNRLVTLAKGGWTWSRTLADFLDIKDVGSVQVRFYKGVSETADKPVIVQSLPIDINGENVLLFDDVDDTGKSLQVVKEYLTMCGAQRIAVATLFHKPWSEITPDFFGQKTQAWIIFPHEIRETVFLLDSRWQSAHIPEGERRQRLLTIGLNPEIVNYLLDLKRRLG